MGLTKMGAEVSVAGPDHCCQDTLKDRSKGI